MKRRVPILALALALALALPGNADAGTDSFQRWLAGVGPLAPSPALAGLYETLGGAPKHIELSFRHGGFGLRLHRHFVLRGTAEELSRKKTALAAWAAGRGVPTVVSRDPEPPPPDAALAKPPRQRLFLATPPTTGPQGALVVFWDEAFDGAPRRTPEAVLKAFPGLGKATDLPRFLLDRVATPLTFGCDDLRDTCRYWSFELGDSAAAVDADAAAMARGRAVLRAAARHGFTFRDIDGADLEADWVSGRQDCSGAHLAVRVWSGRTHVTLQMGEGPRSVVECSAAAVRPR